MRVVLARHVGEAEPVLFNHRPDWLRGQRGKNLELDVFYPSLRMAFEYNGWQHNVVSEARGVRKGEVEAQMQRDRLKAKLCAMNRVSLYLVTRRELGHPDVLDALIEHAIANARNGVLAVATPRAIAGVQPRPQPAERSDGAARAIAASAHVLTAYEAEFLKSHPSKHERMRLEALERARA